jgi:hypothetical protein
VKDAPAERVRWFGPDGPAPFRWIWVVGLVISVFWALATSSPEVSEGDHF